jgi:hydroxyethylthiazole kinase-like uncharacterized protein yjeF
MQKVFQNCYEMDKKCYSKYALSEDILMEHAASAMEQFIRDNFDKEKTVLIIAGAGNNGADGIALARLLHSDYKIFLYLPFGVKSNMAKLQLQRVKLIKVEVVDELKEADIIVDALFGAGLNRELNQKSIDIIETLNSFSGYKIACDIPSGIDFRGVPSPTAFKANITITMGALKEALFLDSAKDYVGKIEVANLGVSRELYEDDSSTFLLDRSDFNPPSRELQNSHKGSFGHVAVFVGEKEGAGVISAMAASRFGAGLTTIVYHEKLQVPPYLMSSSSVPKGASAIAIGMGLGEFFEDEMLKTEVINSKLPIVIDADALYKKELLEIIKQDREVVITPHPKEFSAVLKILENRDISVDEIQKNRFELAKEFSNIYINCTLLLKGANPIIAKKGKIYINTLGSNALAKGGSGDILSGLIASLLAQRYSAIDASINGSLALALASKKFKKAKYSMLPTDIIELIGKI